MNFTGRGIRAAEIKSLLLLLLTSITISIFAFRATAELAELVNLPLPDTTAITMPFFADVKEKAAAAADSTARAAKRSKLHAEIMSIERHMRHCKEEFGSAMFAVYGTPEAETLYAATKAKVDAWLAEIKDKEFQIACLHHHKKDGAEKVADDLIASASFSEETAPAELAADVAAVGLTDSQPEFAEAQPPAPAAADAASMEDPFA